MGSTTVQKSPRRVSIKMAAIALALAAVVPSVLLRCVFMLMYVPSESMYPAITAGDVLVGTRLASSYERGDIVAFETEPVMIKRIIGLPGEIVYVDESGAVYINDVLLDEPYVENSRAGVPQIFAVPEGCVLLFGDNRQESHDARFWDNPYVNTDAIMAVAEYKLFGGKLD